MRPRASAPRSFLRSALFVTATALAAAPPALAPAVAHAQAQKGGVVSLIQRAADLFEDQQYEESIQTLSAALLRPGSSVKEKTEIYRLLVVDSTHRTVYEEIFARYPRVLAARQADGSHSLFIWEARGLRRLRPR